MMDPNLVCKIVVQTPNGQRRRGSGYPITPNRIITAAHVVADAAPAEGQEQAGGACHITLSFGVQAETVEAPVYIEWCGSDADVDVAVLRCQLPPKFQPTHVLLTKPPDTPIKWFAHGYTNFGKEKRPGGIDDFHGELTKFVDVQMSVALESQDGPVKPDGSVDPEQWQGGSGSVAFDSATSRQALAVITRYQGGRQLDHLVAVPICYLLNAESTKDGFCQAIQFESYLQREDHCQKVIKAVASALCRITKSGLKTVAEEMCKLVGEDASGINLTNKQQPLAQQTAECMVAYSPVLDVVRTCAGLAGEIDPNDSDKLHDIVDYLLPLNHAPAVIQRLQEQGAGGGGLGLIEGEVSTRALAEIIMAGYDQQRARFVKLTGGSHDLRGPAALLYPDEPEEGPVSLTAVRNFLHDLAAGLGLPTQPRRLDTDLDREIEGYARQLRGTLRGLSGQHRGRTVYCPIPLPVDAQQRDARKRMLDRVRQHVPELVFVELVPMDRADECEFEIEHYIRVRWMHP